MIPIQRVNGADGRVTIAWKTKDMSATSGQDYEGGEGTITFEHGETTKMLGIIIHDNQVSGIPLVILSWTEACFVTVYSIIIFV